ncbi:MAG: hypothetical protein ABWK05_06765, partial [Pyrobaculum sp.]
GYLRVGVWLAWHRVLGVLDGGRWVLVGDDGLYEAVFTPTVKNPLEEFGEVGYVKVLGPYRGDVDEVMSPCGAPRIVACSEEGRAVGDAVLMYVRGRLAEFDLNPDVLLPSRWECRGAFVIPELVEVAVPSRVLLDWPLADPCPYVLKAADGDPLRLFVP